MSFEEAHWVLRGKRRRKILKELSIGMKNPQKLSKQLGFTLPNTSVTLKELLDKELVTCKNPEAPSLRFYEITKKGIKVLEEAQKLRDS